MKVTLLHWFDCLTFYAVSLLGRQYVLYNFRTKAFYSWFAEGGTQSIFCWSKQPFYHFYTFKDFFFFFFIIQSKRKSLINMTQNYRDFCKFFHFSKKNKFFIIMVQEINIVWKLFFFSPLSAHKLIKFRRFPLNENGLLQKCYQFGTTSEKCFTWAIFFLLT